MCRANKTYYVDDFSCYIVQNTDTNLIRVSKIFCVRGNRKLYVQANGVEIFLTT